MSDINESFQKLIDQTFVKIHGVMVERHPDGCFIWKGHYYKTEGEIKRELEDLHEIIGNSIKESNQPDL